jgi:hypothetical protein
MRSCVYWDSNVLRAATCLALLPSSLECSCIKLAPHPRHHPGLTVLPVGDPDSTAPFEVCG